MKCSKLHNNAKKGFTLIELMIVVVIMGILAGIGAANMRDAVIANRVKDGSINTMAFMSQTANEAVRLADTLCLKKTSDIQLTVYKGACNSETSGKTTFDSIRIDSPLKYGCSLSGTIEGTATSLISDGGVNFIPKPGLSAVPTGYVCMQYGSTNYYGAAVKSLNNNAVKAFWTYDQQTWNKL